MLSAPAFFWYNGVVTRPKKGGTPVTAHPHLRQSAIPPAVAALLKTLHMAGFSAYPVGGCVRGFPPGKSPLHFLDVKAPETQSRKGVSP